MGGQEFKEIVSQELLAETLRLKNEGYRLAAITCTKKKQQAATPVGTKEAQAALPADAKAEQKESALSVKVEQAAAPAGMKEAQAASQADTKEQTASPVDMKAEQEALPEKTSVMELTYTFDRGYDLIHLRFDQDTAEEVESISVIFSFAFLYENEIKELFGVKIKDINIDFHDTLYKIPVKTPFNMKED